MNEFLLLKRSMWPARMRTEREMPPAYFATGLPQDISIPVENAVMAATIAEIDANRQGAFVLLGEN